MGQRDQDDRRTYGSILLDAEGLGRTSRDRSLGVTLAAAARTGTPVVVSAITLAEVLRGGGRDTPVHQRLKSCRIAPVTPEVGRRAGELLGRTGRADTVDAVVAVTAGALPGPVLVITSDPGDLGALTEEVPGVRVRGV